MGVVNLGSGSISSIGACTPSTVSVTSTTNVALAANANRKRALIFNQNSSTVNVLISFAATATAATAVPLAPGQGWVEELPAIYTGVISCITASGTTSLQVFEWS